MPKDLKADNGHTLPSERELEFQSEEGPELVIVGTGQFGDLPITPKAQMILSRYGVVIQPTPQAINSLAAERRPYVTTIHVTC